MSLASLLLFILCFATLCGLISSPAFKAADSAPTPAKNRRQNLDGLRGLLALAVFFHHAAVYRQYAETGLWKLPESHFYSMLGPLAVSMFFMITGYLFWRQLLDTNGRPDWRRLYMGRVFRIGPLYLVAAACMLTLSLASAGFQLREPIATVLTSGLYWISLGIAPWREFNGDHAPQLWLAGVTWSIQFEWFFYLSLPLLALLARRKVWAPFALGFALTFLLTRPAARHAVGAESPMSVLICLFIVGMLCASLQHLNRPFHISDRGGSILCLVLVPIAFIAQAPFTWLPVIILGLVFFLIAQGVTVFGPLTTRPMRRLGDISYGIYLLQGFALASAFRPSVFAKLAVASEASFWLFTLAAGVLLLTFSTMAHSFIERPGIDLGRRTIKRLRGEAERRV